MTDAFKPMSLRLVPEPPLAIATSEPSLDFLTGPGLRALIAERIEQIERHGHLPDTDMGYQQAELALAAKSYIDTYIDLELRPEAVRQPGDLPESWPFADLYWKEPSPEQRAKALIKGLALGLDDTVMELFDQGAGRVEIARQLGITTRSVQQAIQRMTPSAHDRRASIRAAQGSAALVAAIMHHHPERIAA